jgi:tetratricopeptide (TPR) repeat protein
MMMRVILCVLVIGTLVCAAGCEGYKSNHDVIREQARDRMNLVNAQVNFKQARQYFEVGQFDKALKEINFAIERYPKSVEYYTLRGRIHMENKRLESALDSFDTAIVTGLTACGVTPLVDAEGVDSQDPNTSVQPSQLDPKDAKIASAHPQMKAQIADACYFAGIVFQRWSDDEMAFERYQQAYDLDPTMVHYLLAAAESLIAVGEYDQAEQLIEPRMAYFEHNAALRQLQGQIALLKGDPSTAARLYGEARLLNPDDNTLLEDLAWAQYAAGEYGECLESVKLLQIRLSKPASGGDITSRNDLTHLQARCTTMLGRLSNARELYLELARIKPADVAIWTELGTVCWELGDYRRVAQCSVQLIALAPQRYEGYMLKGINERQKNNLNEAIALFRQAAEVAAANSDSALPFMLLGQTLEQAGDSTGARQAYTSAIEIDPRSTDARDLLAQLDRVHAVSVAPTP